jgi:hypothetical protein
LLEQKSLAFRECARGWCGLSARASKRAPLGSAAAEPSALPGSVAGEGFCGLQREGAPALRLPAPMGARASLNPGHCDWLRRTAAAVRSLSWLRGLPEWLGGWLGGGRPAGGPVHCNGGPPGLCGRSIAATLPRGGVRSFCWPALGSIRCQIRRRRRKSFGNWVRIRLAWHNSLRRRVRVRIGNRLCSPRVHLVS